MTISADLASVPSHQTAPCTDRLRLAVAAYLPRFKGSSRERDVVLAFVVKKKLPAGGGQAAALANVLDRRAQEFPDSYIGVHWSRTG